MTRLSVRPKIRVTTMHLAQKLLEISSLKFIDSLRGQFGVGFIKNI